MVSRTRYGHAKCERGEAVRLENYFLMFIYYSENRQKKKKKKKITNSISAETCGRETLIINVQRITGEIETVAVVGR
jgi:hypothetical protein